MVFWDIHLRDRLAPFIYSLERRWCVWTLLNDVSKLSNWKALGKRLPTLIYSLLLGKYSNAIVLVNQQFYVESVIVLRSRKDHPPGACKESYENAKHKRR